MPADLGLLALGNASDCLYDANPVITNFEAMGMDMDGFRLRLKQGRTARGLSQKELAALMEVTQVCIWKWEKGKSFPKPAYLVRLADALRTSVSYLCSGIGLPAGYGSADEETRHIHMQHMTDLARHMVAEAASVPFESVNIQIDFPKEA